MRLHLLQSLCLLFLDAHDNTHNKEDNAPMLPRPALCSMYLQQATYMLVNYATSNCPETFWALMMPLMGPLNGESEGLLIHHGSE